MAGKVARPRGCANTSDDVGVRDWPRAVPDGTFTPRGGADASAMYMQMDHFYVSGK